MSATADPRPSTTTTTTIPGPPPDGGSDPLATERAHLADSRAALRAMRADAEALNISDVSANRVTAEVLRGDVERRIAALADLADTPLFFGRLDYIHPVGSGPDPGGTAGSAAGEDGGPTVRDDTGRRFHIGRRHVHDAQGDPMVIDWRAPISQPFYRASPADPQGVALRRRFGYEGGELTALEDEPLTGPGARSTDGDGDGDGDGSGTVTGGNLLLREIERPRVGPMRDIVATIQPEQDEIVRAPLRGSLCVQGAPGTGKTAVGLHRVAYLLYAHRERLARSGTLVIGPNRSFLRYIEQVLPALGELEVRQTTVDALVTAPGGPEARGTDDPAVARLKGDARMAELLRRAVRSGVRMPDEALEVPRGARRWRVPAHEVAEIVRELLERDIRYGAALEALPQRLAHAVLVRMERAGEAPDDRVQATVARSAPVKAMVRRLWPVVDPAKLVLRLLSDPGFPAALAEGLLTPEEVELLPWPRPARGVRSAPWSPADLVLVDEARDLVERTPSLGHVVLDEAQDLSPMQYRAVGRRCSTGSVTVLGDLAQGTTPWATGTWAEAMGHLGKSEAAVAELTRGFRVPREIIAYASRLLPVIAPGLAEAGSVRHSPGSLRVRRVPGGELDAAVVAACGEALAREGSVGLIAADTRLPALRAALVAAGHDPLGPGDETSAGRRLALVAASLVKGLEYDHVVLDEPAAVVGAEPDERTGLRRLYVALTRAVSGLTVVHHNPLPAALT
ncbi:ATP-binding domain-containing protein [Streptomyces sp. ST2-7A]|uniref:HelD family protein n=1 Tax=Streptomyces sp. ST2-7A TaxID=2907214 RepID=UPI001F162DC6|nr:ATP-binding domain-containing protein [Streptomyces sp. ST2-7A]MCE7079112.1 AAA family ATPase [Streptomyces sp. ST2-7A]